MIISKKFRFEASHVLPKHPGKCSRLHGHSWELTISILGSVDPETGFVLDYGILKDIVNRAIIDHVDHHHLGHGFMSMIPGSIFHPVFGVDFYPSSENLVQKFADILLPIFNHIRKDLYLYEVSLDETCTSRATWQYQFGSSANQLGRHNEQTFPLTSPTPIPPDLKRSAGVSELRQQSQHWMAESAQGLTGQPRDRDRVQPDLPPVRPQDDGGACDDRPRTDPTRREP